MKLKNNEDSKKETEQLLKDCYWGETSFDYYEKEFKQIPQKDQEERTKLGKQLYEIVKNQSTINVAEISKYISEGADLEYKEPKKGNFALLVCARRNHISELVCLIQGGADINQSNNYGTTATMAAARHGNEKVLNILIRMGADVNKKDQDGDTALMMAKRHYAKDCFEMLIKANASYYERNNKGETVFDINPETNNDYKAIAGITTSNVEKPYTQQDVLLEMAAANKQLEELCGKVQQDVLSETKATSGKVKMKKIVKP